MAASAQVGSAAATEGPGATEGALECDGTWRHHVALANRLSGRWPASPFLQREGSIQCPECSAHNAKD